MNRAESARVLELATAWIERDQDSPSFSEILKALATSSVVLPDPQFHPLYVAIAPS